MLGSTSTRGFPKRGNGEDDSSHWMSHFETRLAFTVRAPFPRPAPATATRWPKASSSPRSCAWPTMWATNYGPSDWIRTNMCGVVFPYAGLRREACDAGGGTRVRTRSRFRPTSRAPRSPVGDFESALLPAQDSSCRERMRRCGRRTPVRPCARRPHVAAWSP